MLNRFIWYSAYAIELSEPGTLQKNKKNPKYRQSQIILSQNTAALTEINQSPVGSFVVPSRVRLMGNYFPFL